MTKLRIEYCNGCLYCRQMCECRIEDDYHISSGSSEPRTG